MREAGLVVARGLAEMQAACAPGVTTADLDAIARRVLADAGASSSFLGYHGYPAVICASVNDRVVHGIPSTADVLGTGDLISLDFGAIVEGWHGDAAITAEIGPVDPAAAALSAACRTSLWDGIAAVRSGGRLSNISHAVERSIRGSGDYGIVTGYGGHGIGSAMHMDPHILNHGKPGRGPRLEPGMAVAIEPMVTMGSPATRELTDGWTVVTVDGSLAAHWEHTVAILDDGPWVLTAPDGGVAELRARGVQPSARAA
ncbi:MAG: type I methionyl aminopeptidase [Actinobacteria bacterium]|nr:type I methionyl aminopeptidase [Actinomycetota bacterium]